MDDLQYIKEHVSKREILARLYEATADLGYSALKLRQALESKDSDVLDHYLDLIDRAAEVKVCLSLLWDVDMRINAATGEQAAAWRQSLEDRCHEEAERL